MIDSLNFKVANEIYSKITDGTHDSPKQKESGKPLITSKHIKGRNIDFDSAYLISEDDYNKINERSQVHKWDVIVSMIGEYCGYCYIERNDIIDYAVKNVGLYKAGNKLEAEWLYYYLISPIGKAYLNSVKSGSSQPYLTLGGLRKLPILYPTQPKKKEKISKVLSDLDAKIELNNKINHELEAMAKTLYDYWFVQFDFPDVNGKPYKSSGGKMVYNDELKREIPDGWSSNTISGWIANDKSGDWGKEQVEGNYTEKVSCIRGADINGLNGKGEVNAPERYILEKNSHKILEVGDFIIEISGGSPTQSTGRMAFITEETLERFENPLICSNFCKAVTLKEKYFLYNFVYEWNRIYDAGVLFGWEGKTSGIKNFLFESFVTNYKIVQPPKELMELFYEKANPIHAKIQKNLQQNQKLSELRDWLLPMLMNGQVTVGEGYDLSDVELGMVAESPASYNKDKTLEDLFPENNLYTEVACLLAIEKEMNSMSRGKTWVQKTANHLKEIKKEPKLKNVPFEEYYWGMYSTNIAQALDSNPFLIKESNGGATVYKLRSNKIAEIKMWMQEPRNSSFVESARAIVSLYNHPLILNKLDRIELLNTVYRCMQKLGTSDFNSIYQAMREWPMQEQGYANKAEKFKPEETRHMIKFIKDEILKYRL